MKLTIEATEKLTSIDGAPVRLWEGTLEGGSKVKVFVRLVAVPSDDLQACADLERALLEQLPPGRSFPLRAVLA